jgi:ribosomal protein L7/L12
MWSRGSDAIALEKGEPVTVAEGVAHADALAAATKLEAVGVRVRLTQ